MTTIPNWKQEELKKKWKYGLYEIAEEVMKYVDHAWDVELDGCAIEQELQDIEDIIEELAIKIENGEFRKIDDRTRGDD